MVVVASARNATHSCGKPPHTRTQLRCLAPHQGRRTRAVDAAQSRLTPHAGQPAPARAGTSTHTWRRCSATCRARGRSSSAGPSGIPTSRYPRGIHAVSHAVWVCHAARSVCLAGVPCACHSGRARAKRTRTKRTHPRTHTHAHTRTRTRKIDEWIRSTQLPTQRAACAHSCRRA
jgi:hypothetical protein